MNAHRFAQLIQQAQQHADAGTAIEPAESTVVAALLAQHTLITPAQADALFDWIGVA